MININTGQNVAILADQEIARLIATGNKARDSGNPDGKRYVIAYASDFVTPDDNEVLTSEQDAFRALRQADSGEDGESFTILRADGQDADFTHVWEDEKWVKYC